MSSKGFTTHHMLKMLAGFQLETRNEWPVMTYPGMWWNYKGTIYVYIEVEQNWVWYPMIEGRDFKSYTHTQSTTSLEWVIEHNLDTTDVILMMYDEEGMPLYSFLEYERSTTNPKDSLTVRWAVPTSGKAYVLKRNALNIPTINTSELLFGSNFKINTAGIIWNGAAIPLGELVGLSAQVTQLSNIANSAKTAADAATAAVAGVLTETSYYNGMAPYDIPFGYDDLITVGLSIGGAMITRKSRIPANLQGSIGKADTAPTVATVFDVLRNGIKVAEIRIAAGQTNFTFSTQAAIDLAVGDRIKIVAANADTTLKGIEGTILNNMIK